MSSYLYAIIPYGNISNITILENIKNTVCDCKSISYFQDFFLINTCYRMLDIMTDNNGFSWLRKEIYNIAKTINIDEVWYCNEIVTDLMIDKNEAPNYSITDLKSLISQYPNCFLEYDIETMNEKNSTIASIIHDNFHDIVL